MKRRTEIPGARNKDVVEIFPITGAASQMRAMTQRLDIDMQKLAFARQGSVYLEARQKCAHCQTAAECSLWLDPKMHRSERPSFCPNLELFESLKLR